MIFKFIFSFKLWSKSSKQKGFFKEDDVSRGDAH